MDTFHFEPRSYHSHPARRLFHERRPRGIDDMNLSELEVFMLRGRRLQAQVLGETVRKLFARLVRLLRGFGGNSGSGHAGRHRHA